MDPRAREVRGWFGLCDSRITDPARPWWATYCALKEGHAGDCEQMNASATKEQPR